MSVYMIIEIQIKNEQLYAEYIAKIPEVIAKYGGRYLARTGQVTPLSGNWNPERIIIIEFETIEHLRKCFGSEEYNQIAPLHERSVAGKAIAVDSCRPNPTNTQ